MKDHHPTIMTCWGLTGHVSQAQRPDQPPGCGSHDIQPYRKLPCLGRDIACSEANHCLMGFSPLG